MKKSEKHSEVMRYFISTETNSKGFKFTTVNRQVGRKVTRLKYFVDPGMAREYLEKCAKMMHARRARGNRG